MGDPLCPLARHVRASCPLFAPLTPCALVLAVLAMGAVVLLSNVLVQYPINDWLTWGAFSYPVAFLVSNLINRRFGPGPARRVAWIGFAVAVLLSIWVATPRIAIASCSAFIVAQLLDITVFDRLRRGSWWRAPMVATTCQRDGGHHHFLVDRVCRFHLAVGELGRWRPGSEAGDRRLPAGPVPRVVVENGAAARGQLTAIALAGANLGWRFAIMPTKVGIYQL